MRATTTCHPGLLLATLLLGCTDKEAAAPADDTGTTPGTQTTPPEVEIVLSEVVPTVALVRWQTDQPTTGRIRFGEVGGTVYVVETVGEPSTSQEVVLVGLAEAVDAEARVEILQGDEVVSSQTLPFKTGTLPTAVPRPTLSVGAATDSLGGFTLLPVGTLEERWATIADAQGRLVWAWGGEDLDTQRMRLTRDGRGVILSHRELGRPGMDLLRVDFDGTQRWRFNVPDAHHDFDLVDDDTFVVVAAEQREVQFMGAPMVLVGDKVVEVELDGTQRVVWNAWDHLAPQDGDRIEPSSEYMGAWSWSHGNYLRFSPETDTVQFILRNLAYVTEIDRGSGQAVWTLSPATSAGTALSFPHSVWTTDQGLMVFNQRDYIAEQCSGASLLEVDEPSGAVQETWRYDSEQCLSVYYTGNAQPLEDGRALVAFGSSGLLDEVDMATGQLHWRLAVESGWWLLYAERVAALGPTGG